MKHPLDAADFQAETGASDDAVARVAAYLDLLIRWNARINLVGKGALEDPWRRHFLDSAQIAPLLPAGPAAVVDLGSGAGFPGIILAVVTSARVHLVECDARKCVFLNEAKRITGAAVTVHNRRIETFPHASADVVTARACAPLPKLLGFASPLLRPTGFALFLKGRGVAAELTESRKGWKMEVDCFPSRTDATGTILKIFNLARCDGPRYPRHHDR